MTWSASMGAVSADGSYKAPSVSATTSATVTATSTDDPTKSASASLTISPAAQTGLSVTTTGLTSVSSGVTYSANLKASGGTAPYAWSLSSGSRRAALDSAAPAQFLERPPKPDNKLHGQVTDSSSPKQTASQALVLTVNGSTGNGNGVQSTFFGAGFNGSKGWPPTDGQNQIATLSGVRLWDDGVKWEQVNTSNGVYNRSGLDNWLDRAASANMDVLYTFGDTPQSAAAATAPGGCVAPGAYSCAVYDRCQSDGTGTDAYFQAFVTALVTHAAGRHSSYYELWNEPDCKCFWSGTTAQLVRIGKDAAAISGRWIQRENPEPFGSRSHHGDMVRRIRCGWWSSQLRHRERPHAWREQYEWKSGSVPDRLRPGHRGNTKAQSDFSSLVG